MEINKCCKSWMAKILPLLCNTTQGCYAITRRAARHESALLRTPVRQQCWFDSCKDDMLRPWTLKKILAFTTSLYKNFSFNRIYGSYIKMLAQPCTKQVVHFCTMASDRLAFPTGQANPNTGLAFTNISCICTLQLPSLNSCHESSENNSRYY